MPIDEDDYGPQPRSSDHSFPRLKVGQLPPWFVVRQANRGPYGRYLGPGTYPWHVWRLITPRVPYEGLNHYRSGPQWRYIAKGSTHAAAMQWISEQMSESSS